MLLLLFNTVGRCAKSPHDAPHTPRRPHVAQCRREQAVRVKRPYLASSVSEVSALDERARVFGQSRSKHTQRCYVIKLNVGLLLLAAPTVVLLLLLTLCTTYTVQCLTFYSSTEWNGSPLVP